MILVVPLNSVPNQSLNIVLNSQNCTINIWTKNGKTFFDLFLDNSPIIQCRKINFTQILPYAYLQDKFNGYFSFINNDGNTTPINYNYFGKSQSLIYYDESSAVNG